MAGQQANIFVTEIGVAPCESEFEDFDTVCYQVLPYQLPSVKVNGELHSISNAECPICEEGYSNVNILNEHIVTTHIERKLYICKLCATALYNSFEVNEHMKVHITPRDLSLIHISEPRRPY